MFYEPPSGLIKFGAIGSPHTKQYGVMISMAGILRSSSVSKNTLANAFSHVKFKSVAPKACETQGCTRDHDFLCASAFMAHVHGPPSRREGTSGGPHPTPPCQPHNTHPANHFRWKAGVWNHYALRLVTVYSAVRRVLAAISVTQSFKLDGSFAIIATFPFIACRAEANTLLIWLGDGIGGGDGGTPVIAMFSWSIRRDLHQARNQKRRPHQHVVRGEGKWVDVLHNSYA